MNETRPRYRTARGSERVKGAPQQRAYRWSRY